MIYTAILLFFSRDVQFYEESFPFKSDTDNVPITRNIPKSCDPLVLPTPLFPNEVFPSFNLDDKHMQMNMEEWPRPSREVDSTAGPHAVTLVEQINLHSSATYLDSQLEVFIEIPNENTTEVYPRRASEDVQPRRSTRQRQNPQKFQDY